MALKVNKQINLYGVKHKQPPTDSNYVVHHDQADQMPGPVMRDKHIEDKQARARLKDNQGNFCIAVQPGDEELGEFYLSVQFEGPNGRHDLCMNGQNDLLDDASCALRQILEQMGFDGELIIEGEPCPGNDTPPMKVIEAARNLEGVSVQANTENLQHLRVQNEVRQQSSTPR